MTLVAQNKNYNCAAVAIVNGLRVLGEKVSLKEVEKTLRLDHFKGAYPSFIEKGIKKYFKQFKVTKFKPTFSKLEVAIHKGIILFVYIDPAEAKKMENGEDYIAHASMLVSKKTRWKGINMLRKDLVVYLTDEEMDRLVDCKDEEYPVAYLIQGGEK